MSTLAVNNIRAIVSCDGKDTVYENANLFCRDGLIEYIGPDKHDADTVIDGSGMLCYPGLVNAHHHLYQVFSRNLEKVQNMERSTRYGRTSMKIQSISHLLPEWAS